MASDDYIAQSVDNAVAQYTSGFWFDSTKFKIIKMC